MERQRIIHFHGNTVDCLEESLNNGETLELGEIVVITGEDINND